MTGPGSAGITIPSALAGEFPMFSFLKSLVRGLRPARTARPSRRIQRRANLRLEHLEDRMVPTAVTSSGTTLNVFATQGRFITFEQAPNEILIFDNVQGQV